MARGELRVYLGAAPGVGKTYAMLNEGWRRKERGTDVVIGFLETHGRDNTAAQQRDVEEVPRRTLVHRGATFAEMDVDAILARKPQVALIDELAHTNVPGSRNAKRWMDVEELVAAGITVISTVNIQHLESLNDLVQRITGVTQRETVPDAVVRAADQVELVDMTPEALRRRIAHGNVYAADKVDAALRSYFRPGNLGALRELALLWVADRVDAALQDYMRSQGISEVWETRERVMVALTGGLGGDDLIRRASRMAGRANAPLLGVHVRSDDGLTGREPPNLDRHRRLLEEVGGSYREVVGDDVATALLDVARSEQVTQLVLGSSQRSRIAELLQGGSVVHRVIRKSGAIDVHVISHTRSDEELALPRRPRLAAVSPRRRAIGLGLTLIGLPLLTASLRGLPPEFGLPTILLLYLLLVVVVTVIGGAWAAAVAAIGGSLLANWFFTEPKHTLTINDPPNAVAVLVFVVVAAIVATLVDLSARRATEAARAQAESATLARLTHTLADSDKPLRDIVSTIRQAFNQDAVALLRHKDGVWEVHAAAGAPIPGTPGDANDIIELGTGVVLALCGPVIPAADRRILGAFAADVALAVTAERLREQAGEAAQLAAANDLRGALLAAVSHDLRTPLASIKAAVTSLLQQDVEWTPELTETFLRTIDDESDRLDHLVGNLLDMSRLQAGALQVACRPTSLEEVVPAAVGSLGERASSVVVDVPETLPQVEADPALLERVIANLIANAVVHSVDSQPVRVEADRLRDRVEVRVIDRGPGIPAQERERVFQPFQRLGDARSDQGVGLGLAVARGFTTAMGATLTVDDTPGGGTTMVLELKAVP